MSRRGRVIGAVVVVVIVVLLLSLRAIAHFYTDYLWFSSLGMSSVWRRQLTAKVGLAVVFSVAFFLIIWVNLAIADRLAPKVRTSGPDDELLARYREIVEPRQRLVRLGVSVLFALVAGVGASSQWQNWLLFRNGGSFGISDPLNKRDVGWYVFKLPIVSYTLSWLFAALIIVLLVSGVLHYLNGGIRLQVTGQRVSAQVKAHLSVLMAAIALVKAGDYYVQRFLLTLSTRGVVQGATYTDVNAQLPAIMLLILISLFCALLFLFNIRARGWAFPVVAISLWALVAIIAGAAYPWFIQTFQVSRKQSSREAPYITRNISATRAALGLDSVKSNNFDYTDTPDPSAISDNESTIRNIRLLDPSVVNATFNSLEGDLSYYLFRDLDVDRYDIGGKTTQVIISARELNSTSLPQDTWEAKHLIYTHGYGVALSPANAVDSKGRPKFLVSGVPLQEDPSVAKSLNLVHPEIYFGDGIDGSDGDGYAIVKTTEKEQSGSQTTTYSGTGGVALNGFIRKAAFFLRFGDLETMTSDYLTSSSRILYNRDVKTRVQTIAPFLSYDSDPYPVISDGHLYYVLDAYTTSANYPYGQDADTSQLSQNADLAQQPLNYLRNSVKAVVDAYNGSVKFYLTDDLYGKQDPIARAYAKAFPGLFSPTSSIPADLKAHFRYPEDMFRVQTTMWGKYHITNAQEFYTASDQWAVAQDPGTDLSASSSTSSDGSLKARIDPYYLLMRLPDEKDDSFLLFRPFVPYSNDDSKRKLTSFMIGKSDPNDYGKLETYTMTQIDSNGQRERDRDVDGPLIVNDNIVSSSNSNISQTLSLLNSGGSKVDFGNMLIIPIDRSLLYVRPYYVHAANDQNPTPALRKVVVVMGGKVEIGDTLQQALQALFPGANFSTQEDPQAGTSSDDNSGSAIGSDNSGTTTTTTTAPSGTATTAPPVSVPANASASQLLTQALSLYTQAQASLTAGNLGDYQAKNAQAASLVQKADTLLGTSPTGSTSNTSSTTTTTTSGQ